MTRPRLGIVLTEFGIPSEIWALRQAETFEGFEPVYFAHSRRPDGYDLPAGRELHLFDRRPDAIGKARRRVERRLGLASGGLPPGSELRTIRATLQAARLDAVLCHFAWNGVAVGAAMGGKLPVICHVHGRDVTANLRWPANRRALARALPGFAHVVVVGSYQGKILTDLCPGLGFSVIPCGAPTALFAKRPLPERAGGAPVIFVMVGRVSPEKGQMQTVEAFEAIVADGIDAQLVMIGDGPQMPDLRARVGRSPAAGRIRLTGMLSSDRVADELASAHVFIQHSRPEGGWMEGAPVTLVEAGATGLPLIATDVGGVRDSVTTEQNGYLIQPDDVLAQIDAMRTLARDETLRRAMGRTAREVARNLDSARMARRLEDEISAVLHPPAT